jgi:integrase
MATFRKRAGRWQAIIRRRNLKASKSFERLVDARAWATAQEREADLAGTVPGKMIGTLGEVIAKYQKELWKTKRWGDSKGHELKVLHRDLGDRLLTSMTQATIMAYVRGLDLSPGGISSRLSYLREVVKTARDVWDLSVPLAAVDGAIAAARNLKLAGKSGVRTRRPTSDELDAIVAYGRQRPGAMIDLHEIVRVLSILPLRAGELLDIQWEDINLKRRTAIIRGRKHPDINVRESNDQEVPLIEFGGVDTFDLIAGRPEYLPSPFPYKRPSVSSAFGQAVLHCKIDNLHLHDLRAHAASSLLDAGVPIPQVALISGHMNWKTLAKHYARLDPMAVHEAIKRLP